MSNQRTNLEKSLRNASRWGVALGVGFMALGFLWLDQYLSSGGVYLARERTWLNGRGALTAPVSALGGGLALLCFGIYSRFRLRTLRRNSSRAAA